MALREEIASEATSNGLGKRNGKRARVAAKLAQAVEGIHEESGYRMTGPMLRTGEVAMLFGVSERCIRNWANAGKLPSVRTLGKHRLFPAAEIATIVQSSRGVLETAAE